MERRTILPGYMPRKNNPSAVVAQPVDLNRLDAMKAHAPSNAEAYQRQLNMLMYRLST